MTQLFPPKPVRGWANTPLHRTLISDPQWVVEPKKNGDRCLVVYTNEGPQLWNRHGARTTRQTWLGPLIKELTALDLPPGCILDAELVANPKPACDLWIFDIPTAGGTLSHRYEVLREIFEEEVTNAVHLHRALRYTNKATAYESAIATGEEGVVWKYQRGLYQWQNSTTNCTVPCWVKMKP